MKRLLVILFAFFFLLPTAEAQLWKSKRLEVSAGAGPTLFFGDIGGYSRGKNILGFKDFGLSQTRFNINFDVKYRITENVNVRANMVLGTLHASDKHGSNISRGFVETNYFIEPAILGEFYFIKNKVENNYLFFRNRDIFIRRFITSFDFYVFGGVGTNIYNIKGNEALINSGIKKETGVTVVLPIGIGTNYNLSPSLNIGAEICGRYAFSDYLDGYTSQFSETNDVYYTVNLTVTYKFTTNSRGGISFR